MKRILPSLLFFFAISSYAQNNQVNKLPAGKYETHLKTEQIKWEVGDVILLNEGKYKISSDKETGDYRFSIAAQRIFFISGPLKGAYATTTLNNNIPAIIFPANENQPFKLSSEVWGYYKQ